MNFLMFLGSHIKLAHTLMEDSYKLDEFYLKFLNQATVCSF